MKLISIFLILIFLFSNAEAGKHKEKYVAVTSAQVCAASKREAILKLNSALRKSTGIDSKKLYSKNVYIRHSGDSKSEFCLEAVVTKKGFDRYIESLRSEKQRLLKELNTAKKKSKKKERQAIKEEITAYNKKLDLASKLSPHTLKPIVFMKPAKKRVKPKKKKQHKKMKKAKKVSVSFKTRGCNAQLTSDCQINFISLIKPKDKDAKYRWNFGDGTASKRRNPLHRYKKSGNYKVTLYYKTAHQKERHITKTIHISQNKKSKRTKQVVSKPRASFTLKNKVCTQGDKIAFINLAEMKQGQKIQCRWDFGDGRSGQGCRRTHRYKKAGEYTVRLSVTNNAGLSSEAVEKVNIVHPAMFAAVEGSKIKRIERKFGKADQCIIKKGVLTQAYRYGNDWLLVKQNKVLCRVKGTDFKTNLMGNPKSCRWYLKNRPNALYESNIKL